MKLNITPAAQADIREIYGYSKQQWGPARARLYADELRGRMWQLARGQVSGAKADDISPGLRQLVAGSHVIWFRAQPDRLLVIRLLHQSRDAGRWMG